MHILLVEDEARVAGFIARGLAAEGHRTTVVDNARDGLAHGRHGDQDLIVLDRMLPGRDGLELCRQLRAEGVQTPVLMLTALDAVEERVDGLRAGADDYLTKPFDFEELLARIEALTRRGALPQGDETLRCGLLQLDLPRRAVTVDGAAVRLTAREFDLLHLLASTPGRYWSRERILNRVWGTAEEPQANIVEVYISRLRRKLAPRGAPSPIETLRGVGYRLRDDPL